MPNYTFRNKSTGVEWTEFMTMSAREEFLKSNLDIEQIPVVATPLCDPQRLGINAKPDDGFREVLRHIKKNNYESTIDTF